MQFSTAFWNSEGGCEPLASLGFTPGTPRNKFLFWTLIIFYSLIYLAFGFIPFIFSSFFKFVRGRRTHLPSAEGFFVPTQNQRKKPEASPGLFSLAPREGLEPTTNWLTASCSAIELPRNNKIKDQKSKIKNLVLFF